ncbi:MAG: hypothetical protein WAK78_11310 [Candidatus Acidiferrales bacterium]
MTSNQKIAVSAIFLGLLLLANARPSRAQAVPPQRAADVAETAASSSTAPATNPATADQPTPAGDAEPAAPTPGNSSGVLAAAPAAGSASESDWHFTVSPYLWFAGAHGNLGGPNGQEVGFSASPGDLLSHLRIGLMGVAEPRYKRIVMPLDIIWIRLGSDKALPNTPSQGVANARMTEFILTQKLGYRVIDSERVKIDALAGFRYWHYGESVSFTTNTLNFSASQNWVDPLVGGRITGILTPKVEVTIGGDVGGWGVASQIDYQVFGLLGYRIKPALALQVGYRYLYFDYRRSSGTYLDTATSGLVAGVSITLK